MYKGHISVTEKISREKIQAFQIFNNYCQLFNTECSLKETFIQSMLGFQIGVFPFATVPKAFKSVQPFLNYAKINFGSFQKKKCRECLLLDAIKAGTPRIETLCGHNTNCKYYQNKYREFNRSRKRSCSYEGHLPLELPSSRIISEDSSNFFPKFFEEIFF